MGAQNTKPPIGMVFDIETIPQQRTLDMEAPPEYLNKGSRSNMSVAKLVEHQEAQEVKWPQEKVKLGSLDWRRGQILSYGVGWWDHLPAATDNDYRLSVHVGIVCPEGAATKIDLPENFPGARLTISEHSSEAEMLAEFWMWVRSEANRHQVGFNCRDFDCPWLLCRSAANNVTPSAIWQTGRYSFAGDRVDLIDLADVFSWHGKYNIAGWTLDQYCEWFGVDPLPRGAGKDIFDQHQAGEFGLIVEHQAYDILATMGLYQKFAGMLA